MTDKERIIAEIERLKLCTMDEHMKFYCEEAEIEYNTLCRVVNLIKSMQEEPVSDDLEKAGKEWLAPQLDNSYAGYGEGKMMELTHFDGYAMLDAIDFGANWQKAQDQSTIELAEDHAMLAGMEKMKEEMIAKAKSGTVQKDNQVILDNGTYIDLDPSMQLKPSFAGLKEGDRIKVILIKED